ncbi:MAG: bifunctional aspartate kinase/homoserine dehydrogenase I, partial [Bdellovibrionales bacterium]|nr:bifunctional aspartate kinase/homoserine dehydrogenase I [Bdellovibrionales bacterium]
ALGGTARYVDAREIVRTNDRFGNARVHFPQTKQLITTHLSDARPYVVTGFIAATENKQTTTLGRGGSDYTAALIGAALGATAIEIWTDVDGLMTANPRKVRKAFPIPSITYEEAMELSHFGAKVIHPPTLQPAMDSSIPIRIRNTFHPEFAGTVIAEKSDLSKPAITGISSIDSVALLTIQGSGMVGVSGVSSRLFGVLGRNAVNVILITQASSEHTICVAVDPTDAARATEVIEEEFALEIDAKLIRPVHVEPDLAVVSVVGENMRRTPGIAGRVFTALGRNAINVFAIAQGSSEFNISIVVSQSDEAKALNALHDEFFLSPTRTVHLFLAGTGLIGRTFLQQLASQQQHLVESMALDLRVIGASNSRNLVCDTDGIPADLVQERLEAADEPGGIDALVARAEALNLPTSVLIDCTASSDVHIAYRQALRSAVAIVTPNKKAQSASFAEYAELKEYARRRQTPFLYETSVGAGLPVIGVLNDLLRSGDQIHRVQAVLSGTLSYLFNTFDGSIPFSELVRDAQRRGFTEPDPRDDLSGQDVARKLLILSREAGRRLEPDQVEVENLVPESLRKISAADFLDRLGDSDESFALRLEAAKRAGGKLCYVASIEGDTAKVALEILPSDHPFYDLSGSDNVIAFTTDRYRERPLVIQGPGAGAEVTAAGVFADVLRVGWYQR